jgi:mannose-6-phosphate isomerase-like protein (cupin superfamily)
MQDLPIFPAGAGLTYVDVYGSKTPDGQCGGCPHMHLACTEMYYVVHGEGAVEFLTYREGPRRILLAPGKVVYFSPGVIHRLVNVSGDLAVLVLMENSGLPELGDAVMTFPRQHLANSSAYALALAVVDQHAYQATRTTISTVAEAEAMRDLAVLGYVDLLNAFTASPEEGRSSLDAFHRAATALARPLVDEWSDVVAVGAAQAVGRTTQMLREISAGRSDYLRGGAVVDVPEVDGSRLNLSMCGFMWPYLPEGVTFDALSGKDFFGACS